LKTNFRDSLVVLGVLLSGCREQVATLPPKDAGMESPPDLGQEALSEPYCPADGAGGGRCPVNFCGVLPSAALLASNQFATSGADSLCNMGRSCVVGDPVAAGNAFQLTCVDPPTGARAFGDACSTTVAGMRCADDSLCITAPDFPGATFCAALCRTDADCPSDAAGPGRCLEYVVNKSLPNNSPARVGMCTPRGKIAATECARESGCPASQGCVLYGPRTSLRACRAGGTKSLGAACAANGECRSGQCFDHDFLVPSGGSRAACSGTCAVNSDCGADQRCIRLVVGNNGTPDDPLDDLVSGYCRTLFPSSATNDCTTDAGCVALQNGSDTCDTAHGVCYRKAAVSGSACTRDTECMVGGVCSTGPRFVGGYCQLFGCAPGAASGVDACPGASAACAQRGGPDEPIAGCYEGCSASTATCSRAAAGYTCEPPKAGLPASICLVRGGA
jgi:hypothetical protein